MTYRVIWNGEAEQDVTELFGYLIEHISAADAERYCEKLIDSTHPLAEFPRLYEVAPDYGDGVRRIPRSDGRSVLYEVDDAMQEVRILAVVGPRQLPRLIR